MNTSTGASTPTAVPRAKAEGAFIGLAAGDALGWPQERPARGRGKQRPLAKMEFHDWERNSGWGYNSHTEVIRAGEYSDDTQLTLAIARCHIHAGTGWWAYFTKNELPLWTIYERGGGGATKRAAQSWLRGVAPWKQEDAKAVKTYFDAGGNGVAMRVIPHALCFATDDDPSNLLRDVLRDGVATHGHPRALVGAAAYAYVAWWLLRAQHTVGFGELVSVLLDNASTWGTIPSESKNGWFEAANSVVGNYEKIWHQVVDEMKSLLSRVQDGLLAGSLADDDEILENLGAFGSGKGSGTISAAAAIYLTARYAAQPVQGVLRAAFAVGSDTDTIAAMTGGLLGALAGSDWIPSEWFLVQDCEYIRQIANQLAAHRSTEDTAPPLVISEKYVRKFTAELLTNSRGDLDFGGSRRVQVVDTRAQVPASRANTFQAWLLRATDGQTLYVTRISRKQKGEVDAAASEKPAEEPSTSTGPRAALKPEARVAGIKLSVANLGDSMRFYEDVLGLSVVKRTPKFVSFGSLSLVDVRYAAALSGGAVTLDMPVRRNRIEIHVGDLDSVHYWLVKYKVRIVQPITVMPWGERSIHCLDPDGNVVELIERRAR